MAALTQRKAFNLKTVEEVFSRTVESAVEPCVRVSAGGGRGVRVPSGRRRVQSGESVGLRGGVCARLTGSITGVDGVLSAGSPLIT